ncbi:hypothetical protein H5368_10660 [Luteimonas sp. MC1782]|uniref:hypothetical protein n=1 Tax=Luteimonas sp. MC1782 TaxID=2760305 RepID=UPI001600FB05|nr:hypothetical protein [Luteimonas sp. MC1782]MBB1473497.1 hypothetical protein [Luteimonas sp. MC1782]
MRHELSRALAGLDRGLRHEHWHGKTFAAFWDWFNASSMEIEAQASEAERGPVRAALRDLRASAEDAGYAVPDERLGEIIEPPM